MRDLIFVAMMTVMVPVSLMRPLVGVLLFCWLSFMNPQQLNWGMSNGIPWAMIVGAVTLVGAIASKDIKRVPFNSVTSPVMLFLLCITLTSIVALAPPELVWAKWQSTAKTFAFLLLIAALINTRLRIHALIWVMVISLGYYGIRGGIFTLMTGGNFRVWGPPNSMIADNNQIAVALLVVLPLMNYLRMYSAHRYVRVGLGAAMGLTLVAVLGSYSRGALVGVAAVALFLWWNGKNKVTSGVIMAAVLVAALSFMPASWTGRMSTIQNYQTDGSAEGRYAMWETSTVLAIARPLTGGGFMGPYRQDIVSYYTPGTTARAVHSVYFEVIGEHGFPTFLVWLSITVGGLVCTVRIQRLTRRIPELAWARDLAKMIQVAMIAYLVPGALLSLSYWDYYFTALVVIAATDHVVRQQLRQANPHDLKTGQAWRSRRMLGAGAPGLTPT